ncbi:V protein [denalis virus]|uniref:Non-structural protein V n=1 Tax=denalis virus TaxID=2940991 RepID=A0AAE9HQK8_9MONO|nr:V protein [denalis virus]
METKCQSDIRDALQILAVAKETPSPTTKEHLIQRLSTDSTPRTPGGINRGCEGEDRGQEEPGSCGTGEIKQGSNSGPGLTDPGSIKRSGKGLSSTNSKNNNEPGIQHPSVCQDDPNEDNGGSSNQLNMGETSRGVHMHYLSREGKSDGGCKLGEDDDQGSGSYVDVEEIENPKSESEEEEEVEIFNRSSNQPKHQDKHESNTNQSSAVVDSMTDQDIREALGAPAAPRPKRLTGLGAAASSLPSSTGGKDLIKRGHRREYNFIWTQEGFMVESWCNPTCARIKALPTRERCRCRQCPRYCPQCITQDTTTYKS